MSWWTKLRDSAVRYYSFGLYDPEAKRHAEADQRHLINSQIKAYKEQTELTRKELADKKEQEQAERRRVQEKQVRALRRNYRSSGGMLGTGSPAAADMNSQLGG